MVENDYSKIVMFKNSFLSYENHLNIIDIGSFNNDSNNYKQIFNVPEWDYVGLDVVEGSNVDFVVKDIYHFNEIKDDSFDVVISIHFFEYLKFYWKTMSEIKRILKPGGYVCIIVSSSVINYRPMPIYNKFQKDDLIKLADYFDFEIAYFSTIDKFSDSICFVIKDSSLNNTIKCKLNKLEEKVNYLNNLL